MPQISIEINDAEVQRKLDAVTQFAEKKAWLFILGDKFHQQIKKGIWENRDWNGKPFAPNSPTTILLKGMSRPLIETGKTREEIDFESDGETIRIYSNRPQAAVLQFGAKRGAFGKTKKGAPIPWGDIPARPYFPDDDNAQKTATEFLLQCIEEQLQ